MCICDLAQVAVHNKLRRPVFVFRLNLHCPVSHLNLTNHSLIFNRFAATGLAPPQKRRATSLRVRQNGSLETRSSLQTARYRLPERQASGVANPLFGGEGITDPAPIPPSSG